MSERRTPKKCISSTPKRIFGKEYDENLGMRGLRIFKLINDYRKINDNTYYNSMELTTTLKLRKLKIYRLIN